MTIPKQPPKKRRTNQKSKGNKYERDTAKRLSKWMFGDNTILYKHEDSGARKVVYNGDITPKHISKYPWPIFPFVIECKNGYAQNIPTLMNQNHLRKWLKKLLDERTDEQRIPLFIAQYHHQIPILMTTIILRQQPYMLALNVHYQNDTEFFYVYKFNEVLQKDFMAVMPDWFPDVIKKDDSQTTEKNTVKENNELPSKEAIDDRPLTKKEHNQIIGDIIGDVLGINDD